MLIDLFWAYTNWKISISSIFLVILLAYIFYTAFRTSWPELYFSLNDKAALFISLSFKRYFAFRLAPILLITSFVLGVLMKESPPDTAPTVGLLAGLAHALITNGRALFDLSTGSRQIRTYFNLPFQYLLHIITIVSLVLTGYLGGILSQTYIISILTPTVSGLVDNIWSALLAVIITIYLREIYAAEGVEVEKVFDRSREKVDPKIFLTIDSLAPKYNANPTLAKAICIIENIQRPKWFRRLEGIKAFLRFEGTYGIMQVQSKKPLSDLQSVEVALATKLKNTERIRRKEDLEGIIKNYNSDERCIDLVIQAMFFLDGGSVEY